MDTDLFESRERRRYFFHHGQCFECRQCGHCCVGAPGTIYVSAWEIDLIAAHLNLDRDRFTAGYLYPYKDSFSIREDETGRCLFFDQGCRIYTARPHQCRTYPFWFSNLRSRRRWERICRQCPGIDRGRRYSQEEILQIASTTMHI